MKKTAFVILLISFVLLLSSCSFSTANYTDLAMTTQINTDNTPVYTSSVLSTDAPMIYITGVIKNAPVGTVAKAEWYYLEIDPAYLIDDAEMITEFTDTAFNFSLSIPDNGWPEGNYEVWLYIDGTLKSKVSFTMGE